MTKNTKKIIFVSVALSLAFVGSYINFSEYKPKSIKQVPDVKGLQTDNTNFPLPEGSKKVGVNKSGEAEQVTFHTNKPKNEIQAFYKNIYISNKWELEAENDSLDFSISRYRKGNEVVSVITLDSNDEYKTLVSLETKNQ